MSLNLTVVTDNWVLIILGVLIFASVKGLCIYIVARITRTSHVNAIDRMFMMVQGGEFAFRTFFCCMTQRERSAWKCKRIWPRSWCYLWCWRRYLLFCKKYLLPRLTHKPENSRYYWGTTFHGVNRDWVLDRLSIKCWWWQEIARSWLIKMLVWLQEWKNWG